jgi:hypothetical protein
MINPVPKPPKREKKPKQGLRPFSLRRQREAEEKGITLHNTFRTTDPKKRLLQAAQLGVDFTWGRKREHKWSDKARAKLKRVGERGKRLESERAKWRQQIYAIHGYRCIYPGCYVTEGLEIMHGYGKGSHPELHTAIFNGFPGCIQHHRTAVRNFETTPKLRKALQLCADEMRAAHDGRRPQPSRDELQGIIKREGMSK